MKKYLILLSLLVFVGCSNSSTSVRKPSNNEESGKVALTFRAIDSNFQTVSTAAAQTSSINYPEPTNVRVLIRRFNDKGLQFNSLSDVKVPTDTTIIIKVPARDNYQIDAFSYIDSTRSLKPIIKFDQKRNISVIPNKTTQVSLKLHPISPTFSIPDTVKKGQSFSISANFGNFFTTPVGYKTQYLSYLKVSKTYENKFNRDNSDYYDAYSSSQKSTDANLVWKKISISEFTNRPAYFQIITKLSSLSFYKSDETQFSFVLNYPNPFQQDTLQTFIKTPDGSIGIDIQY